MTIENAKLRFTNPNVLNLLARTIFNFVRLPGYPFPAEISEEDNGISRAKELLREGYGGIVTITHFSMRDSIEMLARSILACQQMFKAPIVAPVELGQSIQFPMIETLVGPLFGLSLFPIANGDTMIKIAQRKLSATYPDGTNVKEGDGTLSFLKAAYQVLEHGGLVELAPQLGRRDKLLLPPNPSVENPAVLQGPLDALVKRQRNVPQKVFFLTLSLSLLKNQKKGGIRGLFRGDYSDIDYKDYRDSFLLGEKFQIVFGPTLTHSEMMHLANKMNMTVDQVALLTHMTSVDPQYCGLDEDTILEFTYHYLDLTGI